MYQLNLATESVMSQTVTLHKLIITQLLSIADIRLNTGHGKCYEFNAPQAVEESELLLSLIDVVEEWRKWIHFGE